jgi:hypothetical protein
MSWIAVIFCVALYLLCAFAAYLWSRYYGIGDAEALSGGLLWPLLVIGLSITFIGDKAGKLGEKNRKRGKK